MSETPASPPSRVMWIGAIFSTALVAAFLFVAQAWTTGFQIARLQAELSQAIVTGSPDVIGKDQRFTKLFPNNERSVRRSAEILSAVGNAQYAEAAQTVRSTILATPRTGRELGKNLEELQKIAVQRGAAEAVVESGEQSEETLLREYLQAQMEVRNILQLPPEVSPPDLASPEAREEFVSQRLQFYEEGVLIGLPLAAEIAPGLKSWDELREALVSSGREVNQQRLGPDMSAALDAIRLRLVNFQQKFKELQEKLDADIAALDEAVESENRVRRRAMSLAKRNLDELTKPPASALTIAVYDRMRSILASCGVGVPELTARAV